MNILTVILSLLPGFAWLVFYLQEDLHPEPKRLIAFVFIVGMASAWFALAAEILLRYLIVGATSSGLPQFLKTALISTPVWLLILALTEEVVKFGAAYLAIHKNPEFDEPIDAMIYMVVVALGFATVENLGALSGEASQTAILSSTFTLTSLRFVGATLLHTLTSAIVGFYWALGLRMMKTSRYLFAGLVLATVLHGIFNYFILIYGNLIYSVVFLLVVGFFVLSDFEKLKQRKI